MSVQAISWALAQTVTVRAAQQSVLVILSNYAGEDGKNAFPAVARLARETRLSERGVQKVLRELEDMALIRRGNQKIAEAYISRADMRPVVYDLNLSLLVLPAATEEAVENRPNGVNGDAERGEPHSPRGATGCTSMSNGVNGDAERGERGAPDPSYNHHLTVNARTGAREAATPSGGDPDGPPAGSPGEDDARPRADAPAERKALSDAQRERFYRQLLIVDWLLGVRPFPAVLRALGVDDRVSLSEAEIEALALSSRLTHRRAANGLVKWAQACVDGDATQKAPIPVVQRLMEFLADPVKRALIARRLKLLADGVARDVASFDGCDGDDDVDDDVADRPPPRECERAPP